MNVFLADDHVLVRDALRRLLEDAGDITIAGEASAGEAVIEHARSGARWDVLLLDLELEGLSGFEVLRRVLEIHPGQRVLVMSMHPEKQLAARLLRAGAAGYLSKGRSGAELLNALREIHAGRRYVTADTAAEMLDSSPAALSDREAQVLALLASGQSPSDIGRALDLRASTVSTHLAHIKTKVGARNLADLVQFALRHGLAGR